MSEIVIELVQPQKFGPDEETEKVVLQQGGNANVYIEPMEIRRRGRWVKSQEHSDWADSSNRMAKAAPEELPGYHVSIDIRRRKVGVYDPLYGTPKGDQVMARFEPMGGLRLEKPKELSGLADQQLWVWLKWAYRVVRGENAELVKGEFPKVVADRVEQERQWDLAADPNTGKRPWEPEPSLEDGNPSPKQPQKSAA